MKGRRRVYRLMISGVLALAATIVTPGRAAEDAGAVERLFGTGNLVAWCVVPFDAAGRGPAERAAMLKRLGFSKLAYDWRAEHAETFEQEIQELQKQDIQFFAFWDQHDEAFRLFEKYGLRPQIWKTCPSPAEGTQQQKVAAAARQLMPLVQRTHELGCKLALYNHGGWGGEPENLVAVCRYLRQQEQADHVGIVYNMHHGHEHIERFPQALEQMLPYLLCLNLNGMNDRAEPKILPLGRGTHERQLLKILVESGYRGPVGILDHRPTVDAEEALRANLDGLERLKEELQ